MKYIAFLKKGVINDAEGNVVGTIKALDQSILEIVIGKEGKKRGPQKGAKRGPKPGSKRKKPAVKKAEKKPEKPTA